MRLRVPLLLAFGALPLASCGQVDDVTLGSHSDPITARCSVTVSGYGTVDVENDYLPNVINCENGAASDEALRAQAVAARTYLYYQLQTGTTTLTNSTSHQVYKCGKTVQQRHKDAVKATSGYVLTHVGIDEAKECICSFFVAGAVPSTSTCKAAAGDNDYSNTEKLVTYNEGKTGSAVKPSPQGSASNPKNRGTLSQNGSDCLSKKRNYKWPQMMKFYYGDDIILSKAVGSCIDSGSTPPDPGTPPDPPAPCGTVPAGGGTISESSTCFAKYGPAAYWRDANAGEDGHRYWTNATDNATQENWAQWSIDTAAAGSYKVEVRSGPGFSTSKQARYTVRSNGVQKGVNADQSGTATWVSLGVFTFAKGGDQWVRVFDNTGEADALERHIVADSIRLTPNTPPMPDPDPNPNPDPPDPDPTPDPPDPEPEPTPDPPDPEPNPNPDPPDPGGEAGSSSGTGGSSSGKGGSSAGGTSSGKGGSSSGKGGSTSGKGGTGTASDPDGPTDPPDDDPAGEGGYAGKPSMDKDAADGKPSRGRAQAEEASADEGGCAVGVPGTNAGSSGLLLGLLGVVFGWRKRAARRSHVER